jgi:hypothetical protein
VVACAVIALLSITATTLAQSLHKIREDVLAAYSKEDFTEMMSILDVAEHDAARGGVHLSLMKMLRGP